MAQITAPSSLCSTAYSEGSARQQTSSDHLTPEQKAVSGLDRVMNLSEQGSSLVQHQADEGDEVQADQGCLQPLVVLGQAPEARGPREAALRDPPPRQKDEPFLRLGHLDDLQVDAVLLRRLGR